MRNLFFVLLLLLPCYVNAQTEDSVKVLNLYPRS
jgi:hypothetical protein